MSNHRDFMDIYGRHVKTQTTESIGLLRRVIEVLEESLNEVQFLQNEAGSYAELSSGLRGLLETRIHEVADRLLECAEGLERAAEDASLVDWLGKSGDLESARPAAYPS